MRVGHRNHRKIMIYKLRYTTVDTRPLRNRAWENVMSKAFCWGVGLGRRNAFLHTVSERQTRPNTNGMQHDDLTFSTLFGDCPAKIRLNKLISSRYINGLSQSEMLFNMILTYHFKWPCPRLNTFWYINLVISQWDFRYRNLEAVQCNCKYLHLAYSTTGMIRTGSGKQLSIQNRE